HPALTVNIIRPTLRDRGYTGIRKIGQGRWISLCVTDSMGRLTLERGADMPGDIFSVVDAGADPSGATDSGPGINAALAAAKANVQATGRHSVVFFPAGRYNILVRTGIPAIDVNGVSNISFVGTPGLCTRIRLAGSAANGDWHLFVVRGGSTNIEFRDLSM